MTIIERTTTEEYDEDKRLTSKTVVEKYGGQEKAEEVHAIALQLPRREYLALFDMMCVEVKNYAPIHWRAMTVQEEEE